MREREGSRRSTPDGAQMLLLAGFVISATAIMAIGAYTALQSGSTQLDERTNRPLVDLFLNTRDRAISFFEMVTAKDTALSVRDNLEGYLFSQHKTARSMSLELNASLANSGVPESECVHFVDTSNTNDCDTASSTITYVNATGSDLWSHEGKECYTGVDYDGTNDGLITAADGRVLGAIFWLKVEGVDAELEEHIVIDVPDTDAGTSC